MANDDKATGQGNTGTGAGQAVEAAQAAGKGNTPPADNAGGKESAPPATGANAAGGQQAGQAAGEGKTGSETGSKDGAAQSPKAPEKYELAVPKGADTFIDQADLDEFAKLAKTQDWTNEEAQARLDAQADAVAAKLTAFREATEKDPEYGGDKLADNQRFARAVIDKVRPAGHPRLAAFERLITKTGLANHPEFFAFLADLGRMTGEDRPVTGGAGGGKGSEARTAEQVLYGKKTE